NVTAEFARLSPRKPSATIAAPVIITLRTPNRSSSEPMNAPASPAESGAIATIEEKKARLQPKCWMTGRRKTPLPLNGPPDPEHGREQDRRDYPRIALRCLHHFHLPQQHGPRCRG